MRTCILFVIALSLSVLARAQARRAFVELGDGTEVTGRVVAMDLKHLQLVVDEQIVTIRAADIKNCRFEEMPEPVGSEQLPPPAPIGETAPPRAELTPAGAASTEGSAVAPAETPTDPDAAVAAGTVSEAAGAGDPAAGQPVGGPAAGATAPAAATPTRRPAAAAGARPRTLLGARVEAVDRIYPWLSPTNPAQWASLGLLLFSGLSLIIHISVVVAGAESAAFGRSLGLALVYLVAALGQTALVPNGDFAVFSMLIGNTAMALFSLRGLFGLARSSTFVALAVQLGFLTLAWGVLELISSLLGSVAAA